MSQITLMHGDCLKKLKELHDNSIDSIVTDPPYELGFMGKSWDSTGIANNVEMWKECLRVLKPGGYLLSFGGTRTYHRMASAIEDAGFEVRNQIIWAFGSGFPKSSRINANPKFCQCVLTGRSGGNTNPSQSQYDHNSKVLANGFPICQTCGKPNADGWGTQLKPAFEPICMAMKPLSEKNFAENVLKYGTGGINIDESRVEMSQEDKEMLDAKASTNNNGVNFDVAEGKAKGTATPANNLGRFPANLIHDNSEEVIECFPETKSGGGDRNSKGKTDLFTGFGDTGVERPFEANEGNASRFFKSIIYTAKASKSERNRGCEGLEDKQTVGGGGGIGDYLENVDSASGKYGSEKAPAKNNHPTIKPIALMEYLIKMVTPKGGTVLDPFMGSGSTGVACKKNGYGFVGIEMEEGYIKIAEARIKNYTVQSNFEC